MSASGDRSPVRTPRPKGKAGLARPWHGKEVVERRLAGAPGVVARRARWTPLPPRAGRCRRGAGRRHAPPPLAREAADVIAPAHDGRSIRLRPILHADAEARPIAAVRPDRGACDLPPGAQRRLKAMARASASCPRLRLPDRRARPGARPRPGSFPSAIRARGAGASPMGTDRSFIEGSRPAGPRPVPPARGWRRPRCLPCRARRDGLRRVAGRADRRDRGYLRPRAQDRARSLTTAGPLKPAPVTTGLRRSEPPQARALSTSQGPERLRGRRMARSCRGRSACPSSDGMGVAKPIPVIPAPESAPIARSARQASRRSSSRFPCLPGTGSWWECRGSRSGRRSAVRLRCRACPGGHAVRETAPPPRIGAPSSCMVRTRRPGNRRAMAVRPSRDGRNSRT